MKDAADNNIDWDPRYDNRPAIGAPLDYPHVSPADEVRALVRAEPPDDSERPTVTLELTPASTVAIDRPRWVWDRRIPAGGTTLAPGREGLGKTVLASHLAARLTRGKLEGDWYGRPSDVIYVGLEDDRATVLVPRLVAAGADLDRFLFVDILDGGTFSLGIDDHALVAAAADRDVSLIIVDPLDSHLGEADTHRKSEVQKSIARLAVMAQDLDCGALGIAHFNKGDSRDVLTKVVGSVGFTTSTRSVLAIGEHPDDPSERLAVLAKSNMTDRTAVPALRFRLESTLVDHPDGGAQIDTARAVMLGEEHDVDANSILGGDSEERSALDEAVDWLTSVLANGQRDKSDLVQMARKEGIAPRTLDRAASRADIAMSRDGTRPGSPGVWSLQTITPTRLGVAPLAQRFQPADLGFCDQPPTVAPHSESGATPGKTPLKGTVEVTP